MLHLDPMPLFENMAKNGERFETKFIVRQFDINEYSKAELEKAEAMFKVSLLEIEDDKLKLYVPFSLSTAEQGGQQ